MSKESDFCKCSVCGEFFNRRNLSEVFEHEHKENLSTDKEYFGKRVIEKKLNEGVYTKNKD